MDDGDGISTGVGVGSGGTVTLTVTVAVAVTVPVTVTEAETETEMVAMTRHGRSTHACTARRHWYNHLVTPISAIYRWTEHISRRHAETRGLSRSPRNSYHIIHRSPGQQAVAHCRNSRQAEPAGATLPLCSSAAGPSHAAVGPYRSRAGPVRAGPHARRPTDGREPENMDVFVTDTIHTSAWSRWPAGRQTTANGARRPTPQENARAKIRRLQVDRWPAV